MKCSALLLFVSLCGFFASTHASSAVVTVTPIAKVVQMLGGMLTKGKEEKHAEQVQYAAYKQFCDDTTAEKTKAVQEAEDTIEMLKADIEVAETESMALGKKITELDSDVATFEADIKAANKVREVELADYNKVHKDYSESIEAIEKAVEVVQAMRAPTAQAVSMLSQQIQALPPAAGVSAQRDARRAIDVFLAMAQDPLEVTPPEAHAYEFKSQSIVDMLEKLRDKFADERSEIEKEELAKRHAHELVVQDLAKSVATSKDLRSSKVQQKAKEMQSAATMKGDLTDAETTKVEDKKYLTTLTASCSQKAADFTERQNLRTNEISAIEQAISILSSDKVQNAGLYTSASAAASFVQLKTAARTPDVERAVAYLSTRAEKINSRVLSALAIRARDDPFAKVKKMVQELINRLMAQANEEASHKGWCDTELAENEQVRTSRTSQVESLTSEIDEKKSEVVKLGAEIVQLTTDLAATKEQSQEDAKLRAEDKAANEATVKDAQEAQTAVGQAITVLKEFYEQAGQATALMQKGGPVLVQQTSRRQPEAPAIFDSPYTGMGGENGGVIAMLEVIQSDYARLESTTNAMEATAAKAYETAKTEAEVTEATLQKDIEHKTHQKQTTEETVVNLQNDLTSSEKELEAANNYYDKLKPSCVDSGMTFTERNQRREEEIASLQEALRILNGEDVTALG